MLFQALSCNPARQGFVAQLIPALATEGSFHWLLLVFFDTISSLWVFFLFFGTSSLSDTSRGSCIHCLSFSIGHFFKEPWFLLLGNGGKHSHLELRALS